MKYLAATCAVVLLLSACRQDPWDDHIKESGQATGSSLLDVVQANPEWSSFYGALVATGCDTLLRSANTYTVFVPANSAWGAVNMNDVAALKKIALNHIAYEKKLATENLQSASLQMLSGKVLRYDAEKQTFNGAKVTSPDHVASNGVLHVTDKLVEMNDNVWDNILKIRNNSQVAYLRSLGHREMDMERSVQRGVNEVGQPVYDTVWVEDVNDFLKAIPLNDEAKEWTYIVLENSGFVDLQTKYTPYFRVPADPQGEQTAALVSLNICRDFAFEGKIDITQHDTLTGVYGVKVPVKNAVVRNTYESSNGIVYVIDKSNILLREKIKPIVIEGEDFVGASDKGFVYKRYRQWASGAYDIILSGQTKQSDTVPVLDSLGVPILSLVTGEDSVIVESKTFSTPSSADVSRATVNNFYVEYKATVNSASYRVHYVAFDDVGGFSSDANHILRIEQKLFISMPGRPALRKGNSASAEAVTNGYLGDTICFVGQSLAGVHEETQLSQWTLEEKTQFLKRPLTTPQAAIMVAPNVGDLTLWLCNTTRSNSTRLQGMMFLDYIKLTPILPEE
ncbi:MAG: fasciclin domain-containing protein [Prevotellaceae bacterium]|jgi:uncharacterized surface protein with fasciclin (FAS1) repeats|nr:fasciclin domain-containing protein [Prevotellaceae bacterium]